MVHLLTFICIVLSVSVSGYQGIRARAGLRAAVNARLEEISFRAGLMAATIALVALSAIAAVTVYALVLRPGGPAGNTTRVASASGAPVTTRTVPASPLPRTQEHRQANPRPKAHPRTQQPVTVSTTSPQPAAGQLQAQAGSSAPAAPPAHAPAYVYAIPDRRAPRYGVRDRWPGERVFSYWDYRAGMFHQDLGMRIDLVLATGAAASRVKAAWIDRQARKGKGPSDHAPVIVDLDEAPDGDIGPVVPPPSAPVTRRGAKKLPQA